MKPATRATNTTVSERRDLMSTQVQTNTPFAAPVLHQPLPTPHEITYVSPFGGLLLQEAVEVTVGAILGLYERVARLLPTPIVAQQVRLTPKAVDEAHLADELVPTCSTREARARVREDARARSCEKSDVRVFSRFSRTESESLTTK